MADLASKSRGSTRICRPLALWRSERLPNIEAAAILEVRRELAGRVSLLHRAWPAARRGDAAAAIAAALDLTRGTTPHPAAMDLAVSALLVAAWRGNAAAETVLTHVLAAGPFPAPAGGHGSRPARPGRRKPAPR